MGRPKIKTIDSAIELDKVSSPEGKNLPSLDDQTEEVIDKQVRERLAVSKTSAKKSGAKNKNIHSKRYLEVEKLVQKGKSFPLEQAIELLKKTSKTKFDSTVEAHVNLRIDPTKQDQQIRTTASLPHGSGKKIRVLVFGAKNPSDLKETGAQVGTEETLVEIEKGKIDFDKVVASPDWMPKLAKVAKILGPKGLMPNPKSGTVTTNPEKTVKELSNGMIEIKTETSPIIHTTIGKISFKEKDLEANIRTLIESIKAAKPADLKKELIASVYLSSTMGPSVRLDLSSLNSD